MRPEIKQDDRLRENIYRQPIDIRIKSLSINCRGFHQQPDYSHPCKDYHTLVNQRNDLLHGNVAIDALRFNEVYFLGRVPLFKRYRTMWERSFEVELEAMGFAKIREEFEVVRRFITYLQTCLTDTIRVGVKELSKSSQLGLNKADQRVGLLFSATLVDFKLGPRTEGVSGGSTSASRSEDPA